MRRDAITLIALLSMAGAALAQYSNSDPRSQEYQRRERELKEEKDKADKQRLEESSARDAANYQAFMENQRRLQEKLSGDVERDRALFLKTPPIPPQKNALLGRWRLDKTKKKPANPLAELNAMISQPACEMVFGDGIWDFRPGTLYSHDVGFGETKLTDVDYRGNEGMIGVIPKVGKLFVFQVVGPDRVQELTSTRIGADACAFTRVSASATAVAPAGGARAAGTPAAGVATGPAGAANPPGRMATPPPAQVASVAPPAPATSRPSPEVCRNTLVDQLGKVGSNQVRAMSDVRFKEAVIEGKVPNTNHLRIDLRGSACDDPRIKATLYDFDANEMLQSITYVWARPPGPAPAPIFTERVTQLSRFHTLPPPQSPGRLQADTSLGRLIIEDLPERNLLLEAYKAPK